MKSTFSDAADNTEKILAGLPNESYAIVAGNDSQAFSAIAWAMIAQAHATNRMAIAIESHRDAMRNIDDSLRAIARNLG